MWRIYSNPDPHGSIDLIITMSDHWRKNENSPLFFMSGGLLFLKAHFRFYQALGAGLLEFVKLSKTAHVHKIYTLYIQISKILKESMMSNLSKHGSISELLIPIQLLFTKRLPTSLGGIRQSFSSSNSHISVVIGGNAN
jgi:hypothetical protein